MLERWYKNMVVDDVTYDGIFVEGMSVVAMHPITRNEFEEMEIRPLTALIDLLFEHREKQLEDMKNKKRKKDEHIEPPSKKKQKHV